VLTARPQSPSRLALLAVVIVGLLLPLAGCRPSSNDSVTVVGSTSVQPFAELLAEEYAHKAPLERINVQGGGSSAGIEAVNSGAALIGMSSRDLKGDETKLVRIEIASDAIAIIVNPKNPVQDLQIDQVRDVFDGKIKRWSELGGPDRPIVVVTREEGSGTRGAFQDMMMGKAEIDPGSLVQDSNGAVRQLVGDDPNAIGYISLGLVNQSVKAISLDHAQPNAAHVADGTYRLVRPFLFVLREMPADGIAKHYIDFTLSPEGQKLLKQEGLLPPATTK
jgi:phosphate transport system substrate-binding protein